MPSAINHYWMKMTEGDTLFFQHLGQRITTQRKALGMTQKQLANHLGISQQHMASFEKGIRKIPASMLPLLAQLFGTSTDDLIGTRTSAPKPGPAPKLQRQIEQVALLPKAKQKFVSEMLDTVIQQSPH